MTPLHVRRGLRAALFGLAAAAFVLPPPLPARALPLPTPAQETAPAKAITKPEPPDHTLLWRVDREDGPPAYLFGTIHVPDDRVNTLHPQVKEVLIAADAVYGEVAPEEMEGVQELIAAEARLPEGQTLHELLPEDLWNELDEIFQEHSLPLQLFDHFEPFMISVTLESLDLLPQLSSGKMPLDLRILKVAQAKGKRVGGVERAADQVDMLANTLTVEEQIHALSKAVEDYQEARADGVAPIERFMRAWLAGSEKGILALSYGNFDPNDSVQRKFMEAMLFHRNQGMADAVDRLLREDPDDHFVFLFGTLHFVGPENVVELLRRKGYRVTRLLAPTPEMEEAWLREEGLEEAWESAVRAMEGLGAAPPPVPEAPSAAPEPEPAGAPR